MPLKQLLEALTLVPQSDIDVQKELATWSIRGDFVVRVGASNEQVLEALSTIFTEERKFPMTMTLKEVEKPVFVLTGKWNYQGGTALGEAETRRGAGPKVDGKAPETVDIYGGETLDPTWRINGGGASSGGARALVGPLSRWTGEVVIVDAVEGAPDAIGWRTYAPPGIAAANPVAHDAKSVLEHVAAQTGLKLTQETRKVKHLVVELKTQ